MSASQGVLATRPIGIVRQMENEWSEADFWERSVSDIKLNVVFLVDDSGTMNSAMPGIRG